MWKLWGQLWVASLARFRACESCGRTVTLYISLYIYMPLYIPVYIHLYVPMCTYAHTHAYPCTPKHPATAFWSIAFFIGSGNQVDLGVSSSYLRILSNQSNRKPSVLPLKLGEIRREVSDVNRSSNSISAFVDVRI